VQAAAYADDTNADIKRGDPRVTFMEAPNDEQILWPEEPPSPCHTLGLVGNGFDLSLGYASSYSHFRTFFRDNELRHLEHGGAVYDIWAQLERIAGENWCDFEACLTQVELPGDVAEMEHPDRGDLSEHDALAAAGHDYATEFIRSVATAFSDWVATLTPNAPKPSRHASHLVRTSDVIVTFNYTDSLTEVFEVDEKKVLHIHGTARGRARPYFGGPAPDSPAWSRVSGSSGLTGAIREQALGALLDGLTKRPRTDLLDRLLINCPGNLRVVSSFGFSFGEADLPYVRHLIANFCGRDTVWINHVRNAESAEHFYDLMDRFSFPGIAATCQF